MSPNDADGMANSVDPDQTAPLGISIRKLRIITVQSKSLGISKIETHLKYFIFCKVNNIEERSVFKVKNLFKNSYFSSGNFDVYNLFYYYRIIAEYLLLARLFIKIVIFILKGFIIHMSCSMTKPSK